MLTIPKPVKTLDFQIEASGNTYSIPYAKNLPLDYMERMADIKETMDGKAFLDLLHEVMDAYAPGAWKELDKDGLDLLLGAWIEGLGEA